MTVLEVLIQLEEAGIRGPWRNQFGELVWYVDEKDMHKKRVRRAEAAMRAVRDRLLPMLMTTVQAGFDVEVLT
jgi:hypothetical protein